MFLLSLLIDGFCPAMNEQTKKVHFQAKHLGYGVDDLVVITYRNQSEGKMACQIKHSIIATERIKHFKKLFVQHGMILIKKILIGIAIELL